MKKDEYKTLLRVYGLDYIHISELVVCFPKNLMSSIWRQHLGHLYLTTGKQTTIQWRSWTSGLLESLNLIQNVGTNSEVWTQGSQE